MRIRQLASALVLLGSASAYAQDNSFLIDPNVSPEGGTLANCDAFPDYQQPLDSANFGTARTSDAQIPLEVAEDIVSGTAITTLPTGTIAGVRFWGISAEARLWRSASSTSENSWLARISRSCPSCDPCMVAVAIADNTWT